MHGVRVALPLLAGLAAVVLAWRSLGGLEPPVTAAVLGLALLAQLVLLPLVTALEHARARALGLHLLGPALVTAAGLGLALLELDRLHAALVTIEPARADTLFFAGARAAARPLEAALLAATAGLAGLVASGLVAALRRARDKGGRGFAGGLLVLVAGAAASVLLPAALALGALRRGYALAAGELTPAARAGLAAAEGEAATWLAATPTALIALVCLAAALLGLRAKQARFFAGPRLVGAAAGVVLALGCALTPSLYGRVEARVHADHAARLEAFAFDEGPLVDRGERLAVGARARRVDELPARGAVQLALRADARAPEIMALALAARDRRLRLHLVARLPAPAAAPPAVGYAPAPPLPVALPLSVASDDPDGDPHDDERAATLGPGALLFPGRAPVDLGDLELEAETTLNLFLDPRATAQDLARLLEAAEAQGVRVRLVRSPR